MHRRLLQRLMVLAAFAVLWIMPAQAHASILPTCDNRDLITILHADPLPCDGSSDDVGDSKVGALCDPRGASAIAPQRVPPVSDGRIEATPGCVSIDLSMQTVTPAPKDLHTMGPSAALADSAMLALEALVPPASYELGPAFAPLEGRGPSGEVRDVYHPPR